MMLDNITMLLDTFNNGDHQERYSRARFNANANRRVAYRCTLALPQERLHNSTSMGAFAVERWYGTPAFWSGMFQQPERNVR